MSGTVLSISLILLHTNIIKENDKIIKENDKTKIYQIIRWSVVLFLSCCALAIVFPSKAMIREHNLEHESEKADEQIFQAVKTTLKLSLTIKNESVITFYSDLKRQTPGLIMGTSGRTTDYMNDILETFGNVKPNI